MKFRYEAFDRAGNLVEGELEASSTEEARILVRDRGVTPFAVRGAKAFDVLFRDITFERRHAKPKDGQLARLTRDLAVLLQAGLPLDAALRIASSTSSDPRSKALAESLLNGVIGGASLAEVMEENKAAFRPEYIRIVQAGEISADLGAAVQDLAELLERRVEIHSRVRAAMAYPALLVALAALSLWIVLGLLVPAVTPIFLENGMPLPVILASMDAIRRHGLTIMLVAAGCGAGMMLALVIARRDEGTRRFIDRLYLSVPVVGGMAQTREAARFTRTLATLIKAGVPPLQALQASCPLVRNDHLRQLLEQAVTDVRAGVTIGDAMTNSAALPAVARQMIAVGEESGRLQDMLQRAASILERQEQTRTTQLIAILTPAVTILVSGMIAGVILSVMGAILSINDLALQ
jgi:general secretion pathway protein F